MSKLVKQLQMDELKKTFANVSEFVFMSVSKMDAVSDNFFRRSLRKKNIHLQVVKNSLARRALNDLGITIPAESPFWAGPTTVAWGANSLADLSRTIETELKDLVKKNAKLKEAVSFKGAVSEGQQVAFSMALKMPTRAEAIGSVLAAILGPGGQIAGALVGPASQIAGQIQTISEKKEEAAATPPA
jgi:large subunit ribosomal protein L10